MRSSFFSCAAVIRASTTAQRIASPAVHLHPLGVTVAAALAMLGLPFWWAMVVLLTWLLFAACEVTVWVLTLRTERRRHDVRNLIERELASIRRDDPTVTAYPRAWRPFLDRAPLSKVHRGATCPR